MQTTPSSESTSSLPEDPLRDTRDLWGRAAATFDDEPDHGLRDPVVRQAWTEMLRKLLPANRAAILDAGCGTGSLSIVLAGLGHAVTGIDLSPAMISLARAKAAAGGHSIAFQVMDAAQPQLAQGQFDVIVCRHLLWALPGPAQVLERWVELLRPGGRLVLIKGRWGTGAGLAAQAILGLLPSSAVHGAVQDLSHQPELWGREVADERYAVIADVRRFDVG
jgi:2-polyprenyl-3-methyl-5-hydroxy-6-metoxy-1,4-benzoquinol methylase